MLVDSMVYSFMMRPKIFKILILLPDLVTYTRKYIHKNLFIVFKSELKNVYKF
jgi:hypothetical protein